MINEKSKRILLIIFIAVVIGGSIFAIIYTLYSPMMDLKSNTLVEYSSYKKEQTQEKTDNQDTNMLSNIDITKNSNSNDQKEKTLISAPIETEIAKYSTTIYDKEESRIHNIKLAVEKLDGTIIYSGDEFSFNETIGPMGKNEGYQKATGFNGNGKKVKIYGGGMCQISSTLYNAALIANLEITERHPHSRRVYYVPKDKDATVSYGGADLRFKNNRDNAIKISATTDGHDVTIKLIEIG